MSNKIQDLNKIFVDVPSNKADDFLSAYYSPVTGSRSTDYDNKIAFLHGKQQIFTQGDLFGGSDLTVGTDNSFVISGTTYTLTINDGVISVSPYTASSWGTCNFTDGKITTCTPNQNVEYDSSYNAITVTVTPSNKINYTINHGTTKILLCGIQVSNGVTAGESSYVYGGAYTMSNNTITHIDNIGDIAESDYSNTNISSYVNISSTDDKAYAAAKTESKASGTPTSPFDVTATSLTQTATIYYHELGTSAVKQKTISTSTTATSSVTVYKGYFVWEAIQYSEPSTTSGYTQKPDSITTHQGDLAEGKYAWFATTQAPTIIDGAYKKPVFNDGKYDGGWGEYRAGGAGTPIQTFTHYSTNDVYYVYRTEEVGLGDTTWKISEYDN